jgi:Protein of unknown function (DUF2613)
MVTPNLGGLSVGSSIIGGIAALVVGAALAGATVFGVVSSQTGAPDKSPTSVNAPVVDYGTN